LDASLEPVPPGAAGELYVGGDGLARGYWRRPDLTAEKFVPDPFSDDSSAQLYRTGDLARHLPSGALEFLGRVDRQFKIRGYRIEPGEIEAAIRQFAAVKDAVVVVHEGSILAAHVATADPDAQAAPLREFLLARLPRHMVPSEYSFAEALPYTLNGKVDVRRLERATAVQAEEQDTPATALETELARLFSGLLRVTAGPSTDFFQAGGHSLLAARLLALIEREMGHAIPMQALFKNPTPRALAAFIAPAGTGGEPPESFVPEVVEIKSGLSGAAPLVFVDFQPMFRHMAPYLSEDRAFHGLAVDAYRHLAAPCSVQDLAEVHTGQIERAGFGRELIVGGWSAAGVAALELARQLRERGYAVPLVVLIDTLHFGARPASSLAGMAQRMARRLRRNPVHRWPGLMLDRVSRAVDQTRYFIRLATESFEDPNLRDVSQIALEASQRHVAAPYDGPVLMIRASDTVRDFVDPMLGWRGYFTGPFQAVDVEANHISLFEGENARRIAKAIEEHASGFSAVVV